MCLKLKKYFIHRYRIRFLCFRKAYKDAVFEIFSNINIFKSTFFVAIYLANIWSIVPAQVEDKDPGRHGQVASVEIIEGDPDAHFRVTPSRTSPSEFNIEVLKLLDREIAPKGYNLTIKATDKGVPPR